MSITRQFRLGVCCLVVLALALMLDGCRRVSPGESLRNAAGARNAIEVTRILAQNGRIVDDPDPSSGMTPLEWAVIAGDQAIVTTLLAHGANVNIYDRFRMNPLAHAVRKDNWPMVQLLLDHGASTNNVRFMKEGVTPLMIAAIEGHKSMAEHLLAGGADRTARSSEAMTAVEYARKAGYPDVVALLEKPATTVLTTQPGSENGTLDNSSD